MSWCCWDFDALMRDLVCSGLPTTMRVETVGMGAAKSLSKSNAGLESTER